ncbi:hypothetical protein IPA_02985 [Ignicoccus pacificus DSM 13166]|uniref:Uncharacterized protein n=1 Tax=Ignicoccus pacificus DSM 13166 TaxID=940294 RepID=A0A977KBV1_9CREN|nr:hypothetical protein IPA_02985 [Ignicoccus pacificus DSM 13166]
MYTFEMLKRGRGHLRFTKPTENSFNKAKVISSQPRGGETKG